MSSVIISGDTSGAITVSAPAVAGTNTLTLQAATATNSVNTRGTAVNSTSGTSIDFTGLPDWIKKITVMMVGVSTNGTSNFLLQMITGTSTVVTSGYGSSSSSGAGGATSTAGNILTAGIAAANLYNIAITCYSFSGNTWLTTSYGGTTTANTGNVSGGNITLGATLTGVRLTTVNGTDTFDAGSVNILYEG